MLLAAIKELVLLAAIKELLELEFDKKRSKYKEL